ncbi:TonB-dependent receptor plug domain-containing protein [Chlorogloeopsis fritschii PCC 9212]|uniref:TonB-dependent receptor plug domain-containing protein n=1 Tax=Chlorogloeopsis fritschii TaxID=1124 RepID=UPI00370D6398
MESRQSKEFISVGILLAFMSFLVQPAVAKTELRNSTSQPQLLVQQKDVSVVKVTGVKVNSTDKGIEVILESTQTEALKPVIKSEENNYIADIPNAVLALPEGKEFSVANPMPGIVSVSVIQADANTVRVTVTGEVGLPTAELFDSDEGLVFELAPVAEATQPPQQSEQPTSETQPEQPTAESDEPIELVVTGEQDSYLVPTASTATKTDTLLRDIPQAIQVIPQQVLQDQQVRRLNEALRNAPSVISDNSERSAFEGFTIRGFSNRNIIRNGLRDDTNITSNVITDNIEQIEVLRGLLRFCLGKVEPEVQLISSRNNLKVFLFIQLREQSVVLTPMVVL